jgi:polygalacturonase
LVFVSLLIFTSCQQKQEGFTTENAQEHEKRAWKQVPTILERIVPPTFPNRTIYLKEYGAKGDSTTDNRKVIQDAINELAEKGGGRIVFDSGQYFCDGPIHLKSNINLHLNQDARLFFSNNHESYLPSVLVRWEGTMCYNFSPLIYGHKLKNIALTGSGTIDGNATEWSREWRKVQKPEKNRLRQMGNDEIPVEQRVFGNGFLDLDGDGKDDGFGTGRLHYLRPTLVELLECENILIEGLTFKNSPFWTIHPVFSKNITVRFIKVFGTVLNDDGVDPDSCEDVLIEGCDINTRDDAISIKAGRDQDAWNRPGTKNIIIRNNRLKAGANGLCIGSEMSGGVENVFAENNYIVDGLHALNFKCNLDRGGQVQNIYLRNTTIENCRNAMFIFRMDYHGYRGNNFPTKFNDFYVDGITCYSVDKLPFKIVGVESEPISKVYLSNIEIMKSGDSAQLQFTKDILLHNVNVEGKPLLLNVESENSD